MRAERISLDMNCLQEVLRTKGNLYKVNSKNLTITTIDLSKAVKVVMTAPFLEVYFKENEGSCYFYSDLFTSEKDAFDYVEALGVDDSIEFTYKGTRYETTVDRIVGMYRRSLRASVDSKTQICNCCGCYLPDNDIFYCDECDEILPIEDLADDNTCKDCYERQCNAYNEAIADANSDYDRHRL